MKIAIFTDTFYPQVNGVAKTLEKFKEYMDKNGIEYRVFAPKFDKSASDDNVLRFKSFSLPFYPDCRLSIPNYFTICRELDSFKPDIIHVMTEFNMGLCGLRYAKTHKITVVSSYETNIPEYMQYYHLKFLENGAWRFFKWFHTKCNKSYCPSNATVDLLKNKGLTNVEVLARGIEVENFSPDFRDDSFRESHNIDDKIVFLYVGRISPEKDLKVLINVARKLNLEYADKVHFLMVGDGPSLNDLKGNAPGNMTFTGFLRGAELSKIYASADIFMFTSPTETLGLVLLEAMASGLSIISCNAGGVTDNLIDNYNCITCREKNEDDFYKAAKALVKDQKLRQKLSVNARNYAIGKNWDDSFDKLIKDYEEITTAS